MRRKKYEILKTRIMLRQENHQPHRRRICPQRLPDVKQSIVLQRSQARVSAKEKHEKWHH